jgi:hypothetical protein
MANNNRVYYACQSVQLNGPSGLTGASENTAFNVVQGLQSVGINTNFNLDPVYQLGQLDLYDNYEDIPDVEVTLNKVLDGQPTLYSMTMGTGTLASLANHRCGVRLTIHSDTDISATGAAIAACEIMPAYLSSVTYTLPAEGNFTEEVTLVANSKRWLTTAPTAALGSVGQRPQADNPNSGAGIMRRQMFNDSESVLPIVTALTDPATTSASGGIPNVSKIQSITVSMDLGREAIYNLGDRTPYTRYVNFPVEITTEVEVIAATGDMVGASETNVSCDNPKALLDKQIKIVLCDGTVMDLGSKNKLQSVNYTGGDTGGGNATATYSYLTYNTFTYIGPNDALNASNVRDDAIEYSSVVSTTTFPLN